MFRYSLLYTAVCLTLCIPGAGCSEGEGGKLPVNDPCQNSSDCSDAICHAGICGSSSPRTNGASCSGRGECRSFLCQGGTCTQNTGPSGQNCLYNEQCAAGLVCVGGRCGQVDGGAVDISQADLGAPDSGGDAGAECKPPTWSEACADGYCTIPAGCFMMGSPDNEFCRDKYSETRHPVTLTHKFEIGQTEVTQDAFDTLMLYAPSWFSNTGKGNECGKTCPVEYLTWQEAAAYCTKLSTSKGKEACYTCTGKDEAVICKLADAFTAKGKSLYDCLGYRLPTEAEWEHAYRAGSDSALYKGANDKKGCSSCGSDPVAKKIGYYCNNASSASHPVGEKDKNAWGLKDMAGNVYEWVHDYYKQDLGKAPVTDPTGNATANNKRVIRGGGWATNADAMRGAHRTHEPPKDKRVNDIGFRCARTLP